TAIFASLPNSNEAISSPRFSEYAGLIVVAVTASAGDIFICVQASERTIGVDGVGDDPGLKSVASTTARPASIISRARGYELDPKRYIDLGNKTDCTLGDFNDTSTCSCVYSR